MLAAERHGRFRRWFAALVGMVALLAAPGVARGADGALDPSFGTGGTLTTNFSSADQANGVAIDSEGRIVAAGYAHFGIPTSYDFALARYLGNGTPDSSFGSGGKVTTDFSNSLDLGGAVAIDSQGRIIAVGRSFNGADYDFAVARYNADGTPDTSFNSTGKVTTPFGGSDDEANAVAIDSQDRIVVAGYTYSGGVDYDFALARYKTDGTLDTSFDGTGKVTTSIGSSLGGADEAYGVAIDSQGRIVAAGESTHDFALARYEPDGTLDTTFGTGGKVTTAIGSSSNNAFAVAIDSAGRIVAAGDSVNVNSGNIDFALARYNANGALDGSFGSGGEVTTEFAGNDEDGYAKAVAIDSAGRIVAAGYADANGSNGQFALARYNPNGTLDGSFGTGGTVTTDFIGDTDQAYGLAIDTHERIVAAGTTGSGASGWDFALARYIGDATPPTVTIISGVAGGGATNDTTPSFSFSADEPNVSFECRFDSDPFAACTGPGGHEQARFDLAEGAHSFQIRATDAAGNVGTAVLRSFTVDTTPPDGAVTAGPRHDAFTNDSTPTWSFAASEAGVSYRCRLDDAASFSACASPYTPGSVLADGSHTLRVRPIDPAGNRGDVFGADFTVDTVLPVLTIAGPAKVATSGSSARATFRISVSEPVIARRCRVDSRPWVSCTSTYTTPALPLGSHRLKVKATDRAGNVGRRSKGFTVVRG